MTAAASIIATAAAIIWLASPAYVAGLWCRLKLDQREEARRRVEQGRQVDAEWLAVLAATEPSMSAHPAAGRIRDLIAANEAARIDEQWEAMNR